MGAMFYFPIKIFSKKNKHIFLLTQRINLGLYNVRLKFDTVDYESLCYYLTSKLNLFMFTGNGLADHLQVS